MKVFQPVCLLPEHITGYVSGPDIRGTLDIIWTCLEIKPKKFYMPESTSKSIFHHTYLTARKAWWMFLTLMAPELILGKAVADYISTRYTTPELKKRADDDGVPWTITHTFLADMGGFAIEFDTDGGPAEDNSPRFGSHDTHQSITERPNSMPPGVVATPSTNHTPVIADEPKAVLVSSPPAHLPKPPSKKDAPRISAKEETGQTRNDTTEDVGQVIDSDGTNDLRKFFNVRMHNHILRYHLSIWDRWPMGDPRWQQIDQNWQVALEAIISAQATEVGVQKQTSYYYNAMALRGDVWILDAQQLLIAREQGIIEKLPCMTEDEINDHSKGDTVVKAMALFHLLWLGADLIARAVQGLSVTQLEIMTLAFSLCALVTYIALWNKPQDVYTRVYLKAARKPTVADIKLLSCRGPTAVYYLRAETWVPNNSVHYLDCDKAAWTKCLNCSNSFQLAMVFGFIGAVLFGAVHLIAWNFEFPTPVERLLWRIACVLTIVMPIMIVLTMGSTMEIRKELLGVSLAWIKTLVSFALGGLMIIHVIGRLYIIVESLRSLTSLPVNAFVATDILDVFPHLG